MNFRRDKESADETVEAIRALGREGRAYTASVDSHEDDRRMVEAVLPDFGRLDVLVLNAGIASRGQSVAMTDPAGFERVMRTRSAPITCARWRSRPCAGRSGAM